MADKIFLGGNMNIEKSKNSINITQEMDGMMDLDKESDNPNAQLLENNNGEKMYGIGSGQR